VPIIVTFCLRPLIILNSNATEIVKTFPAYIKAAASNYLSLGAAGIVISEQLPNNVWESGSYSRKPSRFAYYDMYEPTPRFHDCVANPVRLSVLELGGPAANVYFVQHGSYAAQAQRLLGPEVVDANYPMDHTHTAPFLADVVSVRAANFDWEILLTNPIA
jgi:rhamnogalacturonan acetylesterase